MSLARTLRQVVEDAKLWLLLVLLLGLHRVALLTAFRDLAAADTHWSDAVGPLLQGLRFDVRAATIGVAVPLGVSLACALAAWQVAARRLRHVAGYAAFGVLSLLCVASFVYYREFKTQVSPVAMELFYDDAGAVALTLWRSYGPLGAVTAAGAVAMGFSLLLARLTRRETLSETTAEALVRGPLRALAAAVAVAVLVTGAARGSLGPRPLEDRDAGVSRDGFLNGAVLNPPFALYYAVKKARRMTAANALDAFLPGGDIRDALVRVTGRRRDLASLDDYLERRAAGALRIPPRHVVLVVMESYEQWPMRPEYAALGLAEGVKGLAARGLWFDRFLPASDGTMGSLAGIVTGLPDAGVHTAHQPSAQRPYPTSLPAAFARLGFRTRLFYGGYLSWQRLGDFARAQGFGEVYGAAHMGGWQRANEWGVPDENLFAFVLGKLDDAVPSFDVVLSTSFHPPYDIDLEAEGFPLRQVPPDVLARCGEPPDLRMLGHFWYADRALRQFVDRAEVMLTRPLFAVTGDHAGRRTIAAHPSDEERALVPFVLYGPEVLAGITRPPASAGGHTDIVPTLIELAAPAGFVYHALGCNLLEPRDDPWGVGAGRVVGSTFVADLDRHSVHPATGLAPATPVPDLGRLRRASDDARAVAWWAIKRGSQLEPR
jgi:phosphoglycerol transferase MdoB-like AlkP superfamily enzyme